MPVKRVLEGLSLVVVGSILLANTTGALSWAVWISIISLWPLLLVAAGIDLIGKSIDNEWVRALSSVLVIAGLVYGAFVLPPGTIGFGMTLGRAGQARTFEKSEPRRDVAGGIADLSAGAGTVRLAAGSDLVAMRAETPFGEPRLTVEPEDGNKARVRVEPEPNVGIIGVGAPSMDIKLDRDIPWDVTLSAGAAEVDADLSELRVENFALKTGVADSRVRLGSKAAQVRMSVNAGLSSTTIEVPKGFGVRVLSRSGLVSVNVPPGFAVSGDIGDRSWTSPGFEGESRKIEIVVEAGISTITVRAY